VARESQRPPRFWASRIIVGSVGRMERSSCGARRRRNGWWPSSKQLRRS
jgi:hypothetical protein